MKLRPACCRYQSLAALELFVLELNKLACKGDMEAVRDILIDEDKMERVMNTLSRADNLYHQQIMRQGDDDK